MNNKKLNFKKIKKLSKFDDDLKERMRDKDFNNRHILAMQRLELAHEIMQSRQKAKITQSELAQELSTSQSFVARIENGNQNITIDILIKIANVLSQKLNKPIKFQINGVA